MQFRTQKRILAAVLGGCILAVNVPLEIRAAEQSAQDVELDAVFSDAVLNRESVLTLTTNSNVNGEKEITFSDYIPEQEYVQDGLVLWLDGIDNAGKDVHDSQSEYWMDITDNTQIKINRDDKDQSEGTNVFTDTAFQLNQSKVYLPDKVAQTINGDGYTVEFVVDSKGYSGYEQAYSPLMTVDEKADSWSIFTRTAGKTMELKQGANYVRLQNDFENVYDTTSAITFQKNKESVWYANGQKKSGFTSSYNAEAQKIILGGRLRDASGNLSADCVTSASYHAIRIYNRALSTAELRQNAVYDQMRYYGRETNVPDVKINNMELSKDGSTTVHADFENGVAKIPVVSKEAGTIPVKVTIDGVSCSADLVTGEELDVAAQAIPDSLEFTEVSDTVTPSVIRERLKEKIATALQGTVFVQDGGSFNISGYQDTFTVELKLGEETKIKTVNVTVPINGYDTDIYEPTTSLVMSPSVVSENDGKNVSELISGKRRPSTIIRTVSANMSIVDAGQEIDLEEYVKRASKKALVGFRIDSMEVARAFATYAKEHNLVDVMVISGDAEILLAACNRMAGLHGMLDCGAYENDANVDIFELISKTNESNSRILVLPQKLATKENIQYIQARAISVWVRVDKEQVTDVILNGADGILTDDFENAYDVIESFDGDTPILTRNTVITAHRGLHITAPENSERSARLAVEAGADAVECDVLLTKDGEVVVNHDDTTGRLMNKNLVVADSTLEELQKLTFNTNAEEGDRLPTLKQLFEAADDADPDDDIIHVIEIKTGDTNVIEPMVKIIKEMHMEKRVVFISFYDYQLELVRKAMPNVAVGELNSACAAQDDVSTALKKLCYRMDEYGYFYNCYFGSQNTEIVKAARFRGIYVHPWTVDDFSTYEDEFINNYHGITTNYADYAKEYLNKVTTDKNTYTLYAKDKKGVTIDAKAYTRKGLEIENAKINMKQISGTPLTWDSKTGTCYAEKAGKAKIMLSVTYQLAKTGKSYTVYSNPITVTVENVMPKEKRVVSNIIKKVSEVSLPSGWVWNTQDAEKQILAGGSVEAIAEYTGADKENYSTTSCKVTIERAVCEAGKIVYTGEGEKAPSCGENGLGHKECIHCGAIMESNIVVGTADAHVWDEGVVTKEANATQQGEKTYTCTSCQAKKTEIIEALGAPKKNTILTDNKSKATYKVTLSDINKGTVEYVKSNRANVKSISIPETVSIGGITYQVTSIGQNAFKNNKSVTKLIIPSKITKIGKQAFYGCKNVRTITIKSKKLTTSKIGGNAFKGISKDTTIKVPKSTVDAYEKKLKKKGVEKDITIKEM